MASPKQTSGIASRTLTVKQSGASKFNKTLKKILSKWDDITHPHKELIDKEQLKAGTGYYLKYTNMIKGAADSWYAENEKLKRMTPRQKATMGQSSLENFFK